MVAKGKKARRDKGEDKHSNKIRKESAKEQNGKAAEGAKNLLREVGSRGTTKTEEVTENGEKEGSSEGCSWD
jgi:hypothetical protein